MKKNEKSINKWIKSSLAAFIAVGMVACTGENTTGVDVTDDDDLVETEESMGETWDNETFGSTFASNNRFGEWDANGDTYLDENEYNSGFFNTWDSNRDNTIDENEWNSGARDFGMENENWSDWDSNKDNKIDANEWNSGFTKNEWRSNWDADKDGRINQREYSDGLFGLWDKNKDGLLDSEESRAYNTRYNN
jgi:hypothetical protein